MIKLHVIVLEDHENSNVWEVNEGCSARPRLDIIKRGRVKIPNLDRIETKLYRSYFNPNE